ADAAGRFLRLPECERGVSRWDLQLAAVFRKAAGGGVRRGGAGRSLRHQRSCAHLVRDIDKGTGARTRSPAAFHSGSGITSGVCNMPLRKLEPSFHERVWGTTKLDPWFPSSRAKAGPFPIGEVWFETPEIPLLVKF